MSRRRVVELAIGGAVAGVATSALFHVNPWGLNIVVWLLLALAVLGWTARTEPFVNQARTSLLSIGALCVGSLVALRDSPTLVALDLAVSFALLSLVPAARCGSRLGRLGVVEYAITGVAGGVESGFGALLFAGRDVPWAEIRATRSGPPLVAVARGILISVPAIVIFSALLASADPAFNKLLIDLFRIDVQELFVHALLFIVGAWLAFGWLRRESGQKPQSDWKLDLPQSFRLGAIETLIVLGSIDLLFGLFVFVQFRYFFGGSALVKSVAGLTWAEYARRGFFELAWVAALSLLMLLFLDWIADHSNPPRLRWLRLLALLQVALVLVILVSAWERMSLYRAEFGLTELRLYTSAFMIWIGGVFLWFAMTVLRGRRDRFATGLLAISVIATIALNGINPEEIIVRTNVERAVAGKRLDVDYLTGLSADAIPQMVRSKDQLDLDSRARIAESLVRRIARDESGDWRSWNWSRLRARDVMKEARLVPGVM